MTLQVHADNSHRCRPQDTIDGSLAALDPESAAAAAALLRAEGVTAKQLRSGAVTDAELADIGVSDAARRAITAWRLAA